MICFKLLILCTVYVYLFPPCPLTQVSGPAELSLSRELLPQLSWPSPLSWHPLTLSWLGFLCQAASLVSAEILIEC